MNGLLIDYGGVLTSNVFAAFREFCRGQGLEPDAIPHVFVEDEEALVELHRLERGELDDEAFCRGLAGRLGLAAADGLLARLFGGLSPDAATLAAVRTLHGDGVRTALVSNSWGLAMYDRTSFDELFDAVVLSGEVGLRKPDAEIFLLAAGKIGLEPRECVFVDDLRPNCAAAEALGMTAVLHRGAEGTIAELERLFRVRLSGSGS